jgi:hypothetical protein
MSTNQIDLDFYFGVVSCSNGGCSCSSFSVVMDKSMTNKWEERDVTMVILAGCVVVMVIVLLRIVAYRVKWMRNE